MVNIYHDQKGSTSMVASDLALSFLDTTVNGDSASVCGEDIASFKGVKVRLEGF